MLKLSDFPNFVPNIEGVSINNVTRWLNKPYDDIVIQNKVSNRILYPQAVPQNNEEMEIDLAILRERLKLRSSVYLNKTNNQILIPFDMTARFPDLTKLVWAFVDALQPEDVKTVLLVKEAESAQILGTLLRPNIPKPNNSIYLWVNGKKLSIKPQSFAVIPVKDNQTEIKFESEEATILGKHVFASEIKSGILGIIIDTRQHE